MAKNGIIGTFEGKSADGTIYNANDMLIGTDVWEEIFASDEYKKAIKRGHYIGFLGHPEDPDCQDFEHGCIVMTEGSIDDNGEVFAKFNLIDTPVGRIVKTFIDSGVKFGISVRGAGDLYDGVVDPKTFIFRGFDLVAFPAYDDAMPEFKEVAAASNIKRLSYKKAILAAVQTNVPKIRSMSTLDTMLPMFRKGTTEYNVVASQRTNLKAKKMTSKIKKISADKKVSGLTTLYVASAKQSKKSDLKVAILQDQLQQVKANSRKKLQLKAKLVESLMASIAEKDAKLNSITAANRKLKDENRQLKQNANRTLSGGKSVTASSQRTIYKAEGRKNSDKPIQASIEEIEKLKNALVNSKRQINKQKLQADKSSDLKRELVATKKELEEVKNKNLIYCQDIKAAEQTIAELEDKYDKTFTDLEVIQQNMPSNLDDNEAMQNEVTTLYDLLSQYQNAYAMLYSTVNGIDLGSIEIDTLTDVNELQNIINNNDGYYQVDVDITENPNMQFEDNIPMVDNSMDYIDTYGLNDCVIL